MRHKKNCAKDLPDVVHDGRHGGKNKMLIRLERSHHQSADRKDERADQIQTHQFSEQCALLLPKARRDAEFRIHDRLGKDGDQNGK